MNSNNRHDRGRRRAIAQIGGVFSALLVGPLRAETFLSAEQAQALIFPGKAFKSFPVRLTAEERKTIERASSVRVRNLDLKAWRAADGAWFIVDQVIGKHEFIDIAVGLDGKGAVVGIEILTYRESYGEQVRNPRWRAQFHGKHHPEHLELDRQIKNISGATLSCQHITQGINRLTATWAEVLSKR
jgi:hypothetical protein